jgi:hypothetical protein
MISGHGRRSFQTDSTAHGFDHPDHSQLLRFCFNLDRDAEIFPALRKIVDINKIRMVSGIPGFPGAKRA